MSLDPRFRWRLLSHATHSRQKFLNRVGDSSAHGMLNIAVAKPVLNRPSVVAGIR
jgi:hypothetical protein